MTRVRFGVRLWPISFALAFINIVASIRGVLDAADVLLEVAVQALETQKREAGMSLDDVDEESTVILESSWVDEEVDDGGMKKS